MTDKELKARGLTRAKAEQLVKWSRAQGVVGYYGGSQKMREDLKAIGYLEPKLTNSPRKIAQLQDLMRTGISEAKRILCKLDNWEMARFHLNEVQKLRVRADQTVLRLTEKGEAFVVEYKTGGQTK